MFVILFQVLKGETELSHLTTLPVLPVKVNVPEFVPLQTVAAVPTVPGVVPGYTVITLVNVVPTHPFKIGVMV